MLTQANFKMLKKQSLKEKAKMGQFKYNPTVHFDHFPQDGMVLAILGELVNWPNLSPPS